MIIYFNFNMNRVEFIRQQNGDDGFAVDFLMEYALTKNFSAIIDSVLQNNEKIIETLKKEKNYVVLPDEVVGLGNMEVPANRWKAKEYFDTKFNLIYNKYKNLTVVSEVYSKNRNAQTFCFCMTKTEIIYQIINSFNKYSVKINGMTFYSKLLTDYALNAKKELLKQNFLIIQNDKILKFIAVTNGQVVGNRILLADIKRENFAKKYIQFAKSTKNNQNFDINDLDKEIEKVKLPKAEKIDFEDKIKFTIADIKNFYANSNLKIKFDKIVLLDATNKVNVMNNETIKIDCNTQEILKNYQKSYLFLQKKGIL